MKKILYSIALASLCIIISCVYNLALYRDLSTNLVRLHIIANSNSDTDIQAKFDLRDNLLESIGKKIDSNATKKEIFSKLPEFEKEANLFLEKRNLPYRAKISLGKTQIPRKEYNGIVLPKGSYTAIRVILGKGGGENWWCVAYPPLCFTEDTTGHISKSGKKILAESLDKRSYKMITSDVTYKLKIVETAENVIDKVKNILGK